MLRALAAAFAFALAVQDAPAPSADTSKLHADLASSAVAVGEQLIKLKSWDEARAFLELIRAKSDARGEALDKVLLKTEKQTSGLKWDAKASDLIKAFGADQAKKFQAFAAAGKETDAQASRWTQAEGEILDDLLDYVKAYARLTQIRAHYELPKTLFDWKLSVPAVWHARYKSLNPDHSEEFQGSAGFTSEGLKVGKQSITSPDESISDLVEGLIHTPFHRNYILHPGLASTAFGQAKGSRTTSVLDVKSGIIASTATHAVLSIPKDKSTGVAVSGYDDHIRVVQTKSMKELGYPLSLVFYDPTIRPKKIRAKLLDRLRAVETYVSTPESSLVPSSTPYFKNTVLVVSKERLKPETEYKVSVTFESNGDDKTVEWTFRTGH